MSEIDVTKYRFYLDDGSCCSHDTDCTKCIHYYCDWKVHQEQLHRYKQTLDEIKEIANYSFNRSTSEYMAKLELILEKISEVQNDKM